VSSQGHQNILGPALPLVDIAEFIEGLFKECQKLKKNKENKAKRSESLMKKEED
jgi:hypothetical protein